MFSKLDFAAKVRWRKRFDHKSEFVMFSDKIRVKEFGKKHGVDSAKLLYKTKYPEKIPFEELPDSYFIKANHGTGWNILCLNSVFYNFGHGEKIILNGNSINKENLNPSAIISKDQLIEMCSSWLRKKHSKLEWAYGQIEPYILVEEFIDNNVELFDYRVYSFNGKVGAINLGSAFYRKNNLNIFFDENWNEIKLTRYNFNRPEKVPAKPENLNRIIEIAEKLSKGIDFIRIDLFNSKKGILLSEITVYPQAGKPDTPASCRKFNNHLSSMWKLNLQNKIVAYLWNWYATIRLTLKLK